MFEDRKEIIENPSKLSIDDILNKSKISIYDFSKLLDIDNDIDLEKLVLKSKRLTLARFGKTIGLYTPLYVSNKCHNICTYCGFSANNGVARIILTTDEVVQEAEVIKKFGIENLLLVSGEHKEMGVDYLSEALAKLRDKFSFLAIETQPFLENDYKRLVASGLAGVYLYQETYDRDIYKKYHLKGTKSNFDNRLESIEEMCRSGVYKVGLGALLGLGKFKYDSISLAMHLQYLQKKYWKTKFSLSFPRLKPATKVDLDTFDYVTEKELIKLIAAFRLLEPGIDLALSTRERAFVRDLSPNFGINMMSVASKTAPGGYVDSEKEELAQFSIDDDRDVETFKSDLARLGFYGLGRDSIF